MSLQVVVVRRRAAAAPNPSRPRTFTRPPTMGEIADYAAAMKLKARRMRGVQSNNPHAFHEDKSDLVRAWEQLEDAIRKGTLLPQL